MKNIKLQLYCLALIPWGALYYGLPGSANDTIEGMSQVSEQGMVLRFANAANEWRIDGTAYEIPLTDTDPLAAMIRAVSSNVPIEVNDANNPGIKKALNTVLDQQFRPEGKIWNFIIPANAANEPLVMIQAIVQPQIYLVTIKCNGRQKLWTYHGFATDGQTLPESIERAILKVLRVPESVLTSPKLCLNAIDRSIQDCTLQLVETLPQSEPATLNAALQEVVAIHNSTYKSALSVEIDIRHWRFHLKIPSNPHRFTCLANLLTDKFMIYITIHRLMQLQCTQFPLGCHMRRIMPYSIMWYHPSEKWDILVCPVDHRDHLPSAEPHILTMLHSTGPDKPIATIGDLFRFMWENNIE